jgi:hypothetical protein
MKVKIMHIVQSAGGVHKYISMLLTHMDCKCYTHILICSQDYNIDDYKSLTERIEQIKIYRSLSLFNDLKAIKKIRQLINLYHPDIIYCHSSKGGFLGRIAALGLRKRRKLIYNPHGWAFNMQCSKWKKEMYAFAERFLAMITDYVVVISKAEYASALRKRICKEEKWDRNK